MIYWYFFADTFQILTERILSNGTWTGTASDEELAQLIVKNMVDMIDSTSSNQATSIGPSGSWTFISKKSKIRPQQG